MDRRDELYALIPEHRREVAGVALRATLGHAPINAVQRLSGGVSGAAILRVTAKGRDVVLRVEPDRIALEHRQRHFAAMAAAAEAGAAPKVYFADADAGVCLMRHVAMRPLSEHPGGPPGLARALGELLARVRGAAPFSDVGPYPELIGALLAGLTASTRFPASQLAPCHDGLARIAESIPWNLTPVSAHNDVSPRNLLFDGERLWLVDWELAWLSDPMVDLAIASTELAVGEVLECELLAGSFGKEPDPALLARLSVTRLLTRLAYGAIVFDSLPLEPDSLATALTPDGFRAEISEGRLAPGSRDIAAAFARMSLAEFIRGVRAPGFETVLRKAESALI